MREKTCSERTLTIQPSTCNREHVCVFMVESGSDMIANNSVLLSSPPPPPRWAVHTCNVRLLYYISCSLRETAAMLATDSVFHDSSVVAQLLHHSQIISFMCVCICVFCSFYGSARQLLRANAASYTCRHSASLSEKWQIARCSGCNARSPFQCREQNNSLGSTSTSKRSAAAASRCPGR